MDRKVKPATVLLRMSPQLREGLRGAAVEAGCSLNAYAVQVLAAAAGDPARFRAPNAETGATDPGIERDARGYPRDWRERDEHIGARDAFVERMLVERGAAAAFALLRQHDLEDPEYYVEWRRNRTI